MGLNIKNTEVERLAAEISSLTGESKTEAIRVALQERRARLMQSGKLSRKDRMTLVLEQEVWPSLPPDLRGLTISKAEREEILGYGPFGI